MTLAEALAQVDLEPGRTYDCVVKGQRVTVRVVPAGTIGPAARYDESDVMLDAWCDLKSEGTTIPNAQARWGQIPIDIPEIPQDDE
ncbi:MAG: hypothetical protein MUF06_19895 [Pirellulaceae bacterium]|jgi:hypothetical protein|nr:hypothetical protein [Pirellulaceae bacterium]